MNTNPHEWGPGWFRSSWLRRANGLTNIRLITFEPAKVRGEAVPSVVGDEWRFASERRSIQPRVALQALIELEQMSARFSITNEA